MTEVQKKAKVGRPRTSEPNKVIPKEGIVTRPQNWDEKFKQKINIMEMVYDNPKTISKLFVLIDELGTGPIYMFFRRTKVEMHFKSGEHDVYVLLKGTEMNRYYLSEPFCIKIEGSSLFKNMSDSAKNFNSIKFVINLKDLEEMKKNMRLILVYDRKETEDVFTLPISICDKNTKMPSYIIPSINRLDTYPLRYDLDEAHLKQCIGNRLVQETIAMRISKNDDHILIYEYIKENNETEYVTNFHSATKINLICDCEEDENITFTISRDFIKRLTNKAISKYGTVYMSNELRFCFSYLLDPEILEVKTGNKKEKIPVFGTEKIAIYVLLEHKSDTQNYLDRLAEVDN